jgi:hypothetical protein
LGGAAATFDAAGFASAAFELVEGVVAAGAFDTLGGGAFAVGCFAGMARCFPDDSESTVTESRSVTDHNPVPLACFHNPACVIRRSSAREP